MCIKKQDGCADHDDDAHASRAYCSADPDVHRDVHAVLSSVRNETMGGSLRTPLDDTKVAEDDGISVPDLGNLERYVRDI